MSVDNIWHCDHKVTALRRRVRSNGVSCYTHQCIVCGSSVREVSKGSPEVMRLATVDDFDENIKEQWNAERRKVWESRQRVYEQGKSDADIQWRARYDAYMLSDEWKRKRGLVLLRAKGRCEGCGERQAAEVHHLTYAHMGYEFLWELVAVCRTCHARAHGRPEPEDDPIWEWEPRESPDARKYNYFESINRRTVGR